MAVSKREVQFGLLGLAGLLMVLVGVLAARYTGLIGEPRLRGPRRPPEPLAATAEPPATFDPTATLDPTAPRPLAEMLVEPATPLAEVPAWVEPESAAPGSPSELGLAPPGPAGRLTSGTTRRRSVRANGEVRQLGPSAVANDTAHALTPGETGSEAPPVWESNPAQGSAFATEPDAAPLAPEGADPRWANPEPGAGEPGGELAPQDRATDWPPRPSERVAAAPRRRGRDTSAPVEAAPAGATADDEPFAPAAGAAEGNGEGWPPTTSSPEAPPPFDEPGTDAAGADQWVEPERVPSSRRAAPAPPAAATEEFPPEAGNASAGQMPAEARWADGAAADGAPPYNDPSAAGAPPYDDPAAFPQARNAAADPTDGAPPTADEAFAADPYSADATAAPTVEEPQPASVPTEFQPVEPQPAPLASPPRVRGRDRRVRLTGDEEAPPPREPAAAPAEEPIPPVSEPAESPGWAGLRYQVTPVAEPPANQGPPADERAEPGAGRGWSAPPAAARTPADVAGSVPVEAPTSAAAAGSGQDFVVGPQDTYWSIAQQVYGNGGYFKALYEYNRRAHPRPDRLRPGDRLATPSREELEQDFPELIPRQLADGRAPARGAARRAPTPAPVASGRTYVVVEGDTLFDIARYELGRAARWVEIYELNRALIGEDMNRLKPGLELSLPAEGGAGNLSRQPQDAWRR